MGGAAKDEDNEHEEEDVDGGAESEERWDRDSLGGVEDGEMGSRWGGDEPRRW